MKFLLDTHLLIWWADGNEACPMEVRELVADDDNEIYFSTVSVLETAIKFNLHRPDFQIHPASMRRQLLDSAFRELLILPEHAIGVVGLPPIHRDPFDRLLVAQASVEGITLLTVDPKVALYPGPIRLV